MRWRVAKPAGEPSESLPPPARAITSPTIDNRTRMGGRKHNPTIRNRAPGHRTCDATGVLVDVGAMSIEDVAGGRLKIVIDRTFPLAEAAAAHAFIESREAFGRVVLIP